MLRLLVLATDQPLTGWLWRVNMVLTTIMCVFFTGVFGHASWAAATQENDRRSATIFAALTLLFLVAPFAALYLKGRTEEILCPKHVMVHGRPALHFPGDRRGMKLSTMMYPVLAAVCIALGLPSNGGELRPSAVIVWLSPHSSSLIPSSQWQADSPRTGRLSPSKEWRSGLGVCGRNFPGPASLGLQRIDSGRSSMSGSPFTFTLGAPAR